LTLLTQVTQEKYATNAASGVVHASDANGHIAKIEVAAIFVCIALCALDRNSGCNS